MATELTEKEEAYCQYRSQGYTKTEAAKKAYDTNNPNRVGYSVELRPDVQERIQELKEERAEAYGLDPMEQIRRYNELYIKAFNEGKWGVAAKMLERIDILGGFEAPKQSVVTRKGEALKDTSKSLAEDLEKFKDILDPNSAKKTQADKPSEDSSVH